MEPTVNITIDPHPETEEKSAPVCSQRPINLLEATAASFGLGVLVGGMLVIAFSRAPMSDA